MKVIKKDSVENKIQVKREQMIFTFIKENVRSLQQRPQSYAFMSKSQTVVPSGRNKEIEGNTEYNRQDK